MDIPNSTFIFDETTLNNLVELLVPRLRAQIEREHQSRAALAGVARLSRAERHRKAKNAAKARWSARKKAAA